MRRIKLSWLSFLVLAAPSLAAAEDPGLTLIQPAGGFLAADGVSEVPLELWLHAASRAPGVVRATITAKHGRTEDVSILGPRRVGFRYFAPSSNKGIEETLEVLFKHSDGTDRLQQLTFRLTPPSPPKLSLHVGPKTLEAQSPQPIDLVAQSADSDAHIAFGADFGSLSVAKREGPGGTVSARLLPPALPTEGPSYLTVVAVAASPGGFAARASGASVRASVAMRFRMPRGQRLVLEGADGTPGPVRSTAGTAVIENVMVRYGKPIRAYAVRGRKRSALPLSLPCGLSSSGAIVPIPGQTMADGGVGATLLLGLPPSPLGGKPFEPDITVRGAELIGTEHLAPNLLALILRRPSTPTDVVVNLDGAEVSKVRFLAPRAQRLLATETPPKPDEQLALHVTLTDANGDPTESTAPTARLASGRELDVERTGAATFRVGVPAAGVADEDELIVAVDGPRVIAGRPIPKFEVKRVIRQRAIAALLTASAEHRPAVAKIKRSIEEPATEAAVAMTPGGDTGASAELSFLGRGIFATQLGSPLVLYGGGALAEVRLFDRWLAVRSGVEVMHASERGTVSIGADTVIDSSLSVLQVLIPLELGVRAVEAGDFELGVFGGPVLRLAQYDLWVGGDPAAGAAHAGIAGRAGLDANLHLGQFTVVIEAMLDGIGSDPSAASTANLTLGGSGLAMRGDIGLRIGL